MGIMKEKVLDKHPCMLCLVKSVCGMNICENYKLYYRKWANRTHDILKNNIDRGTTSPLYDAIYFCVMSKFVNVPGMQKRIPLSQDKLVQEPTAESYFRQLFFKHFGTIYINT